MKKKDKFISDKESGVRNLTQINKLPVSELTDTEIVKLFFRRFDADTMIMAYTDRDGNRNVFGRLYTSSKFITKYRELIKSLNQAFNKVSLEEIEEREE